MSRGNGCAFCAETHAAAARHLPDPVPAEPGERLRALLEIAEKVRVDGRSVTAEDVAKARAAGADDRAVHDTVLVAALFSMANRYVDGLDTVTPDDPQRYDEHGRRLAEQGYRGPAR